MAIKSVLINVSNITRSVDFYTKLIGIQIIKVTDDYAVLDAVTATLQLSRVSSPEASTWNTNDLQAGFRHVGFKVNDLDARVTRLQAAGIPFHLKPINAEGGVRITFFYDPDGTLLELVEGSLQYHKIYNREAVKQDWNLGNPTRPRFDHVAETVSDVSATVTYFGQMGYRLMAGIHQPDDTRGFEINFLRDGDSSLEIFSFNHAEKSHREPQLSAPGFVAVVFEGLVPATAATVGVAFGLELFTDTNGLVHTATQS